MKFSRVYFPAKEEAALRTEEMDSAVTGSQVLVKAKFDVISAGTELANYHDLPNTSYREDALHQYPRFPGYSASGEVRAVGPEVKSLRVGDKVVVPWSGHCSWFKKEEASLFRIPDGVDLKVAAFTHLASFPMLGVRKLEIQLGEGVMIAGLGLLGLFALQIAKLSGGYPVLGCDFAPERRELALQLGADAALDPQEPDFVEKVLALTDGKGPEAVVEVTGRLSGLQQALEYVARMGRISILGCTRISDEPINVYKYIHGRGVQIIGAHTHTRPQYESRPGAWTEKDDYATYMKLVQAGKLQVEPLIKHLVLPADADRTYREMSAGKNQPLGVLFDWTNVDNQ